mgnify:FL=1
MFRNLHSVKTDVPSITALADQWSESPSTTTSVEDAEVPWHPLPFDSESFSASFPYIFPSWSGTIFVPAEPLADISDGRDLDPEGQLDFMSLLNPLPEEEGAISYDIGSL